MLAKAPSSVLCAVEAIACKADKAGPVIFDAGLTNTATFLSMSPTCWALLTRTSGLILGNRSTNIFSATETSCKSDVVLIGASSGTHLVALPIEK